MTPTARRRRNAPIAAAVLLAVAAVGGCNRIETSTQARLAPEPRTVPRFNATTQPVATTLSSTQPVTMVGQPVRDWPQSTANYQNGDTASGSTGVRYISDVGQLFGRGGRTTRSDVVAVGGGIGASNTTAVATSVGTSGAGAVPTGAGGTAAASVGGPAGTSTGGARVAAGDETVVSNVQSPGGNAGSARTPAIASGSTVNGQVVRGDGSLAPVGSPGAAGTTGSIAAPSGGVSQSVAAQDVGAVDGNAVDAGTTESAAGTPGGNASTAETIAAGAALPFVETGVFVANIVTSPVTFFQERDGIVSGGYQFPPTHTAMPYLPPEPGRVAPRPNTLPAGVAKPTAGLAPLPSVVPATNPAAARAANNPAVILPPVVPVAPLRPTPAPVPAAATMPTTIPTPPTTMPVAAPAPKPMTASKPTATATTLPAVVEGLRKPGTLKRAADVSSNAFVVAGTAPYAGRFEAEPNLTLDNALRGAGVLPADPAGVMVRIQRRGSTQSTPVSLAELRARTGPDALVQPGDILTVVKAR